MDAFNRRMAMAKQGQAAKPAADAAKDKRFAPRRSGVVPAVITFDGAMDACPCVIRDMSSIGARVEIRKASGNPFVSGLEHIDRVTLVVRQDRVTYDCKIIRRTENELGLKFLATPKSLARPGR